MSEADIIARMAPKDIVWVFTDTDDEINAYKMAKIAPLLTDV